MTNKLEVESIIDSLAHLIAGSDERKDTLHSKPKLQNFNGFEVIDARLPNEDDFILVSDSPSDLAIWPMDARCGFFKDDGWLFKRIKTLHPSDWRGKLRVALPKMFEVSEMYVSSNGKAFSSVAPYGIANKSVVDVFAHNHPWCGRRVHPGNVYSNSIRQDDGTMRMPTMDITIGQGIELRREYRWSVLIGEDPTIRARFTTDPIGIRGIFRLRDIPPGRARRAALRHWVSEHWRKSRNPSREDHMFVREYLRGAIDFNWNGLQCSIEPSRDDIRRAKGPS